MTRRQERLLKLKVQRETNARIRQLRKDGRTPDEISDLILSESAAQYGDNPDLQKIIDWIIKIMELIFTFFKEGDDETEAELPAE